MPSISYFAFFSQYMFKNLLKPFKDIDDILLHVTPQAVALTAAWKPFTLILRWLGLSEVGSLSTENNKRWLPLHPIHHTALWIHNKMPAFVSILWNLTETGEVIWVSLLNSLLPCLLTIVTDLAFISPRHNLHLHSIFMYSTL